MTCQRYSRANGKSLIQQGIPARSSPRRIQLPKMPGSTSQDLRVRDPESNVLEFVAGCAVDADIYYLAAAIGPGHEYYDPDPGPPSRMFIFGRSPKEEWFHHDLPDFQVMSVQFVPEKNGRPRRVLALDFYGQLEDYSRVGATTEYISPEGPEFSGGLTALRRVGEDLFCCGVGGMIFHRTPIGWRQLPAEFPARKKIDAEDDDVLDDFESWLDCVGHLLEADHAHPLPPDPAEREAVLRRRFEYTNSQLRDQRYGSIIEQVANLSAGMLNDLCGSGYDDLYAVGLHGLIAHWNGSTWQISEPVTTSHLVHAMMTDGSGIFAVGHQSTIVVGDISTGFACPLHEISEDIDFYCAAQHETLIYIGSNSGIFTYCPESGGVERLLTGLPQELRNATIIDISSADGALWVLTSWDLARFDGSRWEIIIHPDNG
ncbi:hypothetical protein [Stenotrophomonas maltophilia]|uniref:hypothetical protein n=1 Tax=Stenotrophomonas maltophilia TaxID=40324 RepID=UPI0039F6EA40